MGSLDVKRCVAEDDDVRFAPESAMRRQFGDAGTDQLGAD